MRGIQPSLRDLGNTEFGPTVETVGYYRVSLRDKKGRLACGDIFKVGFLGRGQNHGKTIAPENQRGLESTIDAIA